MFEWPAFLIALGVILTAGTGVWLASLLKRDVSIVDSLWPMMFLLAAVTYDLTLVDTGPRAALLLVLVGIWALRLFAYITWRNWGEDEDRRYQAIRANNEPNFELKSLFIVFILQGVIAWIVSLPLMPADSIQVRSRKPGQSDGPGTLALHSPSKLLRKCLYLVGFRPARRRRGRLVGAAIAVIDDFPAAQGVRRLAAGTGYRRTPPGLCRLYRPHQRICSPAAEKTRRVRRAIRRPWLIDSRARFAACCSPLSSLSCMQPPDRVRITYSA
jgi:hypothetical protein